MPENIKQNTSPLVGNPSPEVDRGTDFVPYSFTIDHCSNNPPPHEDHKIFLPTPPLTPTDDPPYGYRNVRELVSRVNRVTSEVKVLHSVRDGSVASCSTKSENGSHKFTAYPNIQCYYSEKDMKAIDDYISSLGDIQEQGGLSNDHVQKMISDARLVQRLADHSVGGGLGKKKRLNRLIAQGSAHRYSGARKDSPKDKLVDPVRISSKDVQETTRRRARIAKYDISEQAFGFSVPSVPVEAGEETLSTLGSFIEAFREKKVDLTEEASAALKTLTEAVKTAANPTITHSFALPSLPSSITSPHMRVFWIGGLLMVTYAAIGNRKLLKALLAITGICALWFPQWSAEAKSYFDRIVEWAKERLSFMKSEKNMVEVEFNDDPSHIREHGVSMGIIDCIIGFMYCTCFASLNWGKNPMNTLSSFFEKTKGMRKIKEGLEFTFATVTSYVQMFLDWVSERFGCRTFNIAIDNRPEITLYSEKVSALLKTFVEGRVLNLESAKEVMNVYFEGNKLAKQLPSSIEYQDSRRLLQLVISELTPLVMKIRRSNMENMGPRIQPIGIILTGPSGVGKTTALHPLMLAVTSNVIKEDQVDSFRSNHNDFIYNRISENEYYDSYRGQMNVIFDDFGQQTDTEGVPQNQYMEVIRMVNSNAMDLHMAHLDDKGLTNFRSRMVWATSNCNKFRLKSIVDTRAVSRRFVCSYVVIPAPGYRKDEKETDIWKMALREIRPEDTFLTDESFPHLQFLQYDFFEGRVINHEKLNLLEVVDRITDAYKFTEMMGSKILETHESFKNKFLERRFPDRFPAGLNDIKEEGCSISRPFIPILDGESMTQYVARLAIINKAELERVRFAYDQERIVENLDWLCETKTPYQRIASAISSYKDAVYAAYCKAYDVAANISFIDLMKTVLAGLATFTAGYGLYRLLSGNDDDGEVESQNRDYMHQRKTASRKPPKGSKYSSFVRGSLRGGGQDKSPQLALDATCDDIIYKIYKKNVYTLHLTSSSQKMGAVTFIGGHDAFMPRHFAENIMSKIADGILPKDTTVFLRAASNPRLFFEIGFKEIDWFFPDDWQDEDIVFARFPNTIPQAPNIRKYITDDIEALSRKFSGKMLSLGQEGMPIVPFSHIYPMKDLKYTNYVNPVGFNYDFPTAEGDCGNLLFVSNPLTGAQKVIGFHVAGAVRYSRGYSTRINRDLVASYDDFMNNTSPYREEGAFESCFTEKDIKPDAFKTLYTDRRSRVPIDTDIVPSPLQNTFAPPKCLPAKLKPFKGQDGEIVDPWLKARNKYAKSSPYFHQETLDLCASSYTSQMVSNSVNEAPWDKKVFSFEEAVAGIPGVPYCDGIPRNTSAGWPECLDKPPGVKGKQHFFGADGEYDFSSPDCARIKRKVLRIIDEARKGNRLKHVYMDFLKDERRKKEKSLAGSSRLVSACPVDFAIAVRMYFLDFMRWFMANRLNNGSAVGVNVFGSEWPTMRKLFRGNSLEKNMIAGDFEAYDGSQSRQLQMTFLKFVNQWYSDGNDLIREILFEDICNSKHIYEDVVYEWPGGNPSGNPLTTILNTFDNNVLLRYAGILSHDEHVYGPGLSVVSKPSDVAEILVTMEHQLFILCYGDDNAISVGPALRLWYNQHTLTRAFEKVGFIYTSEAKDGHDVEPLRSIDDISFLKRAWKYDRTVNTYVSTLDMDTVLESVQWAKKQDRDFNDVRVNVDTTLKELSAHGDAVWNEWYPKIVKSSMDNLDYLPPIPDRRTALALQLSRTDFSA